MDGSREPSALARSDALTRAHVRRRSDARRSPIVRSLASNGEDKDRLPLHRVRRGALEVAGALRHVRRVEHARRGDRRAQGRRPTAARRGAWAARDRSPRAETSRSRRKLRDVVGSSAAALEDRARRIRLRARRRHRSRVDDSRRRRAGHRQVDAAAPGRGAPRASGPRDALRVGRRVAAAGEAARRPTGRERRRRVAAERDESRDDSRDVAPPRRPPC